MPKKKAPKGPKSGNYDIGYGKPPKRTRFAKGQSGNLKGRPPRDNSLDAIIENVAGEKIKLPDGRELTKKEVIAIRMLNDGCNGKNVHSAMKVITEVEKRQDKRRTAQEEKVRRHEDALRELE